MNCRANVRFRSLSFIIIIVSLYFLWVYFMLPFTTNLPAKSVVNLKELLTRCVEIAYAGGEEVKKVINENNLKQDSKGKTREGTNDPVTNADFRSHCVMYHGMIDAFPVLSVISEEKPPDTVCDKLHMSHNVSNSDQYFSELPDQFVAVEDVTIWIDPLDATQEYTEHLLKYVTVMVCVAIKGIPVIGVIHRPFEKYPATIWAWVGTYVSDQLKELNKHRLSSQSGSMTHPKIIVSRSHAGKVKDKVKGTFGPRAEVIPAGGAGYKVIQVLNGNVDAYIHTTAIKKWDVCAGDAILRSVGGHMSTLSNKNILYDTKDFVNNNGILATVTNHNWFHNKFQKII